MSIIIENTDRDFDLDALMPFYRQAAERGYTVSLLIDEPDRGETVFEGDVTLRYVNEDDLVVGVERFEDGQGREFYGDPVFFEVEDVRRIEVY